MCCFQVCYLCFDASCQVSGQAHHAEIPGGLPANFDLVRKHFSIALNKALNDNFLTYEKLNENEKNEIQESIANHFINHYTINGKKYNVLLFNYEPDGLMYGFTHCLEGVYLFHKVFKTPYGWREFSDESIQPHLISHINKALDEFKCKKFLETKTGFVIK